MAHGGRTGRSLALIETDRLTANGGARDGGRPKKAARSAKSPVIAVRGRKDGPRPLPPPPRRATSKEDTSDDGARTRDGRGRNSKSCSERASIITASPPPLLSFPRGSGSSEGDHRAEEGRRPYLYSRGSPSRPHSPLAD